MSRGGWSLLVLMVGQVASAQPVAGGATRTLEASFEQRRLLRLFKTEVVSQGKVYFRGPDHLRWELLGSDASVLLVAGKRAQLRIPGQPRRELDLTSDPAMRALVQQIMVWLGALPQKELARWYRVTTRSRKGGEELSLVPRAGSLKQRIKQITVHRSGDLLRQVIVDFVSRERTTVRFHRVRRNLPLAPGLFKLD